MREKKKGVSWVKWVARIIGGGIAVALLILFFEDRNWKKEQRALNEEIHALNARISKREKNLKLNNGVAGFLKGGFDSVKNPLSKKTLELELRQLEERQKEIRERYSIFG